MPYTFEDSRLKETEKKGDQRQYKHYFLYQIGAENDGLMLEVSESSPFYKRKIGKFKIIIEEDA